MGESSEQRRLVGALIGFSPKDSGGDGFGQGMREDIVFWLRCRKLRRRPIAWEKPCTAASKALEADPFLSRFGDFFEAIGWSGDLACVVIERAWHGFPDPPQFAFFAMRDNRVWAAADMGGWPRAWPAPAQPELTQGDAIPYRSPAGQKTC